MTPMRCPALEFTRSSVAFRGSWSSAARHARVQRWRRHRPRARGRIYLDVGWDAHEFAVEIDGAQHRWGLAVTTDNLRLNAVVLEGDRVLRIDVIGLRLETELLLDQVELGLRRFRAA
jgi:very-short-patch-repair endonuclease